jgi:hypothetical protein
MIARFLARFVAVSALVLAVGPAAGAGRDHPLISSYPDSTLTRREAKDFDQYRLITGLDPKTMTFRTRELEGAVTRLVYTNPPGRSTLEIFRNYRQALEQAGAEVLHACEMEACGPAHARSRWNQAGGLFAASDGDPRYLAARLQRSGGEAFVAVMVGKRRTQLDVVEIKAMDRGLVAVDAATLARGIEQQGSARVYGILFDVDRADVRPESKPTLDAIAARGRPHGRHGQPRPQPEAVRGPGPGRGRGPRRGL